MATVLLLSNDDLTKQSIIGGNVDPDRLYPHIKNAQVLFLKSLLTDTLYEKICEDYLNDNLVGKYLELYEDYIKPLLIHSSTEMYLAQGAYIISNNGITKLRGEDAETVNKNELDFLVESARKLHEHYKANFIKYINKNKSNFPEYQSDCYNGKYLNVGGWHLNKRSGNCGC